MVDSHMSRRRIVAAVVLAWLAVFGFDLLLHAGLLAWLFLEPHPFLLPPVELFRMIPLGYLSFLLFVTMLAWLTIRLRIRTVRSGAAFGLRLGALVHGSLVLGLASISTAPLSLLLGWFVGQSLQAALAAAVLAAAFGSPNLRRLTMFVLAFVVGCIVVTVALQSAGLAPAAVVGRH